MRAHFRILSIVARSFFKQTFLTIFRRGQQYPELPMSLDEALDVRDWALKMLAPAQAEFDANKAKLLSDIDEALADGDKIMGEITLGQQARNPRFEMPDKQVSPN